MNEATAAASLDAHLDTILGQGSHTLPGDGVLYIAVTPAEIDRIGDIRVWQGFRVEITVGPTVRPRPVPPTAPSA